jgi:hypothetical protein
MVRIVALSMLALVACSELGPSSDDDQCSTSLVVTPDPAIVDQTVTVTANIVNSQGGLSDIDWRVRHNQQDIQFETQGTMEITFTPTEMGVYDVDMTPSSSGTLCESQHAAVNVVMGAGENQVRLRVIPPADLGIPPIDQIKVLPPTTDAFELGTVVLDPGVTASGTVGHAAYLKFIPDGSPDAIVEAYTNASGAFSTKLQAAQHHVLVVPSDAAYPPQAFDLDLPGTENLTLSTGTAINGTVLRPNGSALAGAKVQLFIENSDDIEVPSTVATTAANGSFSLRASATTGDAARVIVTPPAGSGLPRLEASNTSFNFANPVAVAYHSSLVTRDIGGTIVTRGGALANAKVTIVGTIPLAAAGSVSTGGTPVQAIGYVRIPATANASGALPSTLVPAADLYAVVEPGALGDAAVSAFDTTTSVPSTITAPAMIAISTRIDVDGTTPLAGPRVELEPIGALGLAGVGPTVLYGDGTGTVTGMMAAGAIYAVRISDPSKRGAPIAYPMLDAASFNASNSMIHLSPALVVSGTLELQGSANRIAGAAVQLLCTDLNTLFACDGIERDRPFGEDASDDQGSFEVAVMTHGPPL